MCKLGAVKKQQPRQGLGYPPGDAPASLQGDALASLQPSPRWTVTFTLEFRGMLRVVPFYKVPGLTWQVALDSVSSEAEKCGKVLSVEVTREGGRA